MSRRTNEYSNRCDCYQAGKSLSDLPCRGCKYCKRLHEEWARFEDDMDDIVPLAVRCIQTNVNIQPTEASQSSAHSQLPAVGTSTFSSLLTSSPDELKPSLFQIKGLRRQPGGLCMTSLPSSEPPLSCTLTRAGTLTAPCLRVYVNYCRSQRPAPLLITPLQTDR